MSNLCGVCEKVESKYKCPHCEVRYCSITCFKFHIAEHVTTPPQSSTPTQHVSLVTRTDDLPTVAASASVSASAVDGEVNLSERLAKDARFSALLEQYPQLRSQLRRVYSMTMEPNSEPAPEVSNSQWQQNGRWSQERADKRALGALQRLEQEDEGIEEFLQLVKIALVDASKEAS